MFRPMTLLAVLALSACGWTAGSARDTAAVKWCDYAGRCNEIGQGRTYATYEECLTRQRSTMLDLWPSSSCENRINAQAMDLCLRAIENTQCNNVIDQFATASKCGRDDVCR